MPRLIRFLPELRAEQEFRRQVADGAAPAFIISLRGADPALEQAIPDGVGQRHESVVGGRHLGETPLHIEQIVAKSPRDHVRTEAGANVFSITASRLGLRAGAFVHGGMDALKTRSHALVHRPLRCAHETAILPALGRSTSPITPRRGGPGLSGRTLRPALLRSGRAAALRPSLSGAVASARRSPGDGGRTAPGGVSKISVRPEWRHSAMPPYNGRIEDCRARSPNRAGWCFRSQRCGMARYRAWRHSAMPPYNYRWRIRRCRARSPNRAFCLRKDCAPTIKPSSPMHERSHLRRLQHLWLRKPVYFLTVCVAGRRRILHRAPVASLLSQALHDASRIHGWAVGRFVIMPDHVHFFCAALSDGKDLPAFVRDWKRWTARKIEEDAAIPPPIWQREFFDHVLRSPKSYSAKWDYVRENPVRAGLVTDADDWPYQGECEALGF